MSRAANLSPLGLYNWDSTVFDLMQIPEALDKDTLITNLLAETAELEVLYPNPVVFKNLVGVWSAKQIDIWNRLYSTTQYEYNPIENYDRHETGSDSGTGSTTHSGTGSTTHSGTDTTTDTTTHGGTDGRTETITTGGKDTLDMSRRDGGTEVVDTEYSNEQGGEDKVTGTDKKGHWIAGFNSQGSGSDDGLVKQTRDEDDATTTTKYGKTEEGTGSTTTTFGKTETNKDETTYGKTENVQESKTYGETVNRTGGITHGEQIQTTSGEQTQTTSGGQHELRAHGNIGVTTTQEMIKQERQVDLFNIYDIIIEDFKMRFCILVY